VIGTVLKRLLGVRRVLALGKQRTKYCAAWQHFELDIKSNILVLIGLP